MRLVFMGTPHFALPTLAALHKAGHDIAAVYSQPPRPAGRGKQETLSPVHAWAEKNNLPVLTPLSLKDADAQAQFAAHKAEAAIVAAYGLLLPKAILEAYPLGCINVHPSLLPRWRGAAPIPRAIMAGDTQTGICIMQMNEGLDTGDVLLRETFDIPGDMNAGELHDALAQRAGPLMLKTLETVQSIVPEKQSIEGVTYAKKITREEEHIDWSQSAETIRNVIRGLSPRPGAYFTYNGENIKLFEAEVVSGKGAPGEALDDALAIACGDGAIRALVAQRPGKKPMMAAELLKGFSIPKGTKL